MNKLRYRKRNYCVNLTNKAKREYYSNLKKFWNSVKPCFSGKSAERKRITLLGDKIITEDKALAETFNEFFAIGSNDVTKLNLKESKEILNVDEIIHKFQEHPSVVKIKENANVSNTFSFALKYFTRH